MKKVSFLLIVTLLFACGHSEKEAKIDLGSPQKIGFSEDSLVLPDSTYYNAVLGALVGSAIGDAMGAPTEMWHRNDIRLKYGYVQGLDPVIRTQSPEGPWGHNLIGGGTTDDTRWKHLMAHYLDRPQAQQNPKQFARFIGDRYKTIVKTLTASETMDRTDVLDERIKRMEWIKEWARVAMAYEAGPEAYQQALNRFYGGEMSCAGQLYTPMFGLVAATPKTAYERGYEHALFDLGYAKDISGLVASMTHMALRTTAMDSIIATVSFVDPYGYNDSRLVGRISQGIANGAMNTVLAIENMPLIDSLIIKDSLNYNMPDGFPGTYRQWVKQEMVYRFLEKEQRSIAFHAGEIWQILITALQFGQGDFNATMQFIINYGRDNDTVAALAGMILGAKIGYDELPTDLKETVIAVNKSVIGIDLKALAKTIVANGAQGRKKE
ncbi:ADP-ribosylglycohydrolase family protein [Maribacter sp. 2-571]|uniref:ADP-ribosylglycohydrolase family protein n=1 Tax=Maribacter sp. 2-571 TaxID=3417569 RepID=UPI003D32726B